MTNQEQYDLINKVCDKVRATLQGKSERLKNVAEGWKNKDLVMYNQLIHDSTKMVEAQISVTAAQISLLDELFKKATKDDDIVIRIEDKP